MEYSSTADPAFSMGADTLTRINFQLWSLNEAKSGSDFDSWFNALRNVYCEGYAFFNEKERSKHKGYIIQVEKAYSELLKYNSIYTQLRVKYKYQPPKKIYSIFIDWELELRIDLDKHGLLMKKGEAALGSII